MVRFSSRDGRRAAGRFSAIAASGLLALAAISSAGGAQQPFDQPDRQDSRVASSSDLARENLSYVAAPAREIEDVLREQPGLLVELQHWIARDATSHGQMVDEREMSQQGIFDRLERDMKFRAAATRLLQRYGYLQPEVNPGSSLAQQQQLAWMAEARRLQAASTRLQPSVPSWGGRQPYPPAGVRPPGGARRPGENPPAPLSPQWEPAPAMPPSPWIVPPSRPLRLQEARQDQDFQLFPRSEGAGEAGFAPEELPRSVQSGLDNSTPAGGALAPGRSGNELAASGNFSAFSTLPPGGDASRFQMMQELRERGQESPSPPEEPLARPWPSTPYYRPTGNSTVQNSSRAPIIHRANPYANVPALYDLYKQVSPHSPELRRFGTDIFENGNAAELPMDLPAGPDYVVGPGDGLVVSLWGSVAQRLYRVVDREGRVALPEVGPVMVSGETLGAVQQRVQGVLRTQFRDVSADVSLARLRTVRIYVVGEIRYPGAYDISSLSTPLNALLAAGGPSAEGSLRQVQHYRGRRLIQNVDLYGLLLHGVRSGLERLENGDTILVPPAGPEVKVEGMVRRPAIYEMHGETSLAEALQLAGGILPTAALRHIEVQRVVAHQKRTMLSLDIHPPTGSETVNQQLEGFAVHDGDAIRIFPIAPYNQDAVYLEGHVLRPGRYSYHAGLRLTDLISSYGDLLPQPALRYAEIIRLNPPDYRPSVESFDLAAALAHPESSPGLQALDTVRVFSRFDFQDAPTVSVDGEVRRPGTYRTSGTAHVRDAVFQAGGVTPDAFLSAAQLIRSLPEGKLEILSLNLEKALAGDPLQNVLLRPRDRILVQPNPRKSDPPSVYVEGEVARPGRFPLTANLRVRELVGMAGGLKRSAELRTADLTSYNVRGPEAQIGRHREVNLAEALDGQGTQNLLLQDGDVLTVKAVPGWNDIGASITLRGEVSHPGTYGIAPGERLSSVLKRAGGFLPAAYPQAAVLERLEVRKLQESSRNELVEQVQRDAARIKVSLNESASEQAALRKAAAEQHQHVLEALRSAPVTGRLVIHLTSDLQAFARSQDDIQVRAGDTLYVPKCPDFVVVTGQVYNSNAITYTQGKTARWYLSRAGGVTDLGNKKAIFIVRSDGAVVSDGGSRWWHGDVLSARVGPGDTIVVPEKPIGGSTLWKNLIQISQVASSAAIAAAVATN